jgi:chemotaxis protein methyltransferase CheR
VAAVTELVEAAVVAETYFFRHPEQLAALSRLAFGPAPQGRALRIWSAGCATGEEAYSVAAALLQAGRPPGVDRVLATDVSARALEAARTARYGRWSLRRAVAAGEGSWLRSSGDVHEVAPEVRAAVELRVHNLLDAPPPGPFDVVLCRNVLIYFEAAHAREVLARVAATLRPGGWLAVAPAELPLAHGLPLEPHGEGGAVLLRRTAAAPRERGHVRHAPPPAARRRAVHAAPLPPPAAAPSREPPRPTVPPPPAGAADAVELVRAALAADARGDLPGALEGLRRALYLDPDLAVAHATLVPLYQRAGRRSDAERARRNALRALEGLDDETPLLAAEALTAGALRSALAPARPAARTPHPPRVAAPE